MTGLDSSVEQMIKDDQPQTHGRHMLKCTMNPPRFLSDLRTGQPPPAAPTAVRKER